MRERARWAVLLLILGWCATAAGRTDGDADLRAGAWDRSLAAERSGDLAGARATLARAYGARPDSYEVAVRLAYLSLKLRRGEEAIALYRLAAGLPGAGPEAQAGLGAALALLGYQELARGERAAARARFTAALAAAPGDADARRGLELAGPAAAVRPELWLGYLSAALGPTSDSTFATFLAAPWQVNDAVTVRVAYRHLEPLGTRPGAAAGVASLQPRGYGPGGGMGGGGTGGGTGPGGAGGGLRDRQDEAYASVRLERPRAAAELMGMLLLPSVGKAIGGPAGTVRLGRDYGLAVDGAGLALPGGWNGQVAPTAFYWPTPRLGLGAGARLTWDAAGAATSGRAGATVRLGRLDLDLGGHYGAERWPVSLGAASVLSVPGDLAYGGTLTATVRVTRAVTLGLQGQLERVTQGPATGSYSSVALGLRLTPALGKETP
jgi:tetratricopeptide (TPR) repeat protein